jgi:hypothetical protein
MCFRKFRTRLFARERHRWLGWPLIGAAALRQSSQALAKWSCRAEFSPVRRGHALDWAPHEHCRMHPATSITGAAGLLYIPSGLVSFLGQALHAR